MKTEAAQELAKARAAKLSPERRREIARKRRAGPMVPEGKMKVVAFGIVALGLMGCLDPAGACEAETRYVAHVQSWNVVCLAAQDDGLQMCAVWPTPPPAPEWVGNPVVQADSGYPLRAVVVCEDVRITDTPIP